MFLHYREAIKGAKVWYGYPNNWHGYANNKVLGDVRSQPLIQLAIVYSKQKYQL